MQRRKVDRSMIIIISLDRALKLRARLQSTYTQGLVSDAWQVQETTPAEQLTEFYKWLSEVHDHPATPKSAEEILRDFDRLLKVTGVQGGGIIVTRRNAGAATRKTWPRNLSLYPRSATRRTYRLRT